MTAAAWWWQSLTLEWTRAPRGCRPPLMAGPRWEGLGRGGAMGWQHALWQHALGSMPLDTILAPWQWWTAPALLGSSGAGH